MAAYTLPMDDCIEQFQVAAALSAAQQNRAAIIETMIRLALTSPNSAVKGMADHWLQENCNVTVSKEKGTADAAPPPANDVR